LREEPRLSDQAPEGEPPVVDPLLAKYPQGKTLITIADNAGGIPREILDRVFEPYVSTKGVQGTGIGLYMSKSIIQSSMGGSLTVSDDRVGAIFRIEL
jgi:signal transduction histidine kinase